jgi:broad specificity phosphatase PhoE/adenylate kinase family enzyme
MKKLCIALVGLPAMGKSTVGRRIRDNLSKEGITVKIFNNGEVRRSNIQENTSSAEFFSSRNKEAILIRKEIALENMHKAIAFLESKGNIAILDATNVTLARRKLIEETMKRYPLLFLECTHSDEEILDLSIEQKAKLKEFGHLTKEEAIESFKYRREFYKQKYKPLIAVRNLCIYDSLKGVIEKERLKDHLPFFPRIRDLLVSDNVPNLYLIRHGQTFYNTEGKIGGDSELTDIGMSQANALSKHFSKTKIRFIFTSTKIRTIQMAEHITTKQKDVRHIQIKEFDEIDAGICENMTYKDIREKYPDEYAQRQSNKYDYIYPNGESYRILSERVGRGIKKAIYLSEFSEHIMFIGHQAVNRVILSHFLYRREKDIPYVYIPQDQYFHIISLQHKKLFELKKF